MMNNDLQKLNEKYKFLLKQVMDLEDNIDILTQQNYELSKEINKLKK